MTLFKLAPENHVVLCGPAGSDDMAIPLAEFSKKAIPHCFKYCRIIVRFDEAFAENFNTDEMHFSQLPEFFSYHRYRHSPARKAVAQWLKRRRKKNRELHPIRERVGVHIGIDL